MQKIVHHKDTSTVKCFIEVEHISLGEGLNFFEYKKYIVANGVKTDVKVAKGVATDENIEAMKKDRKWSEYHPPAGSKKPDLQYHHFVFATPETREQMKSELNFLVHHDIFKRKVNEGHVIEASKVTCKLVEERGLSADNMLYFSWYDHSVCDAHGKSVPRAVHFDSFALSNYFWDMEKALEHLKSREGVVILKDRYGREMTSSHMDGDHRVSMNVLWVPTDKSWQEALKNAQARADETGRKEIVRRIPGNWETLVLADFLGLVDAGCRKPEQGYGNGEDESEDRDYGSDTSFRM